VSFETEYHRRIRRALGVYDDETELIVDEHMASDWDTGCDTCGYGRDEYRVEVTIFSWKDHKRIEHARKTFDSMSDFLASVLKVEDED
jgi:hypothetical protein